MFTGIVEELGTIASMKRHPKGALLSLKNSPLLEEMQIGQSLSINGCCLTLIELQLSGYLFDLVEESLSRTNLQFLKAGDRVNLERPLRYQDRFGGHFVQGHVDGVGKIISKDACSDGSWWLTVSASPGILKYIIPKGSITLDGISLTIADLQETHFSSAIIPHTNKITTLGFKQAGDPLNIEVDMMAKYIERFVNPLKENMHG